jgi:hypothetical protein
VAQTFCGSRISANLARDNAGSLVCLRVPLCRTGWQSYQGSELGLDTDKIVQVYRSAREVFAPATIASANGKAVTDSHPPQFISPANAGNYIRGYAQNPREGNPTADGERILIGDLVVFDASLISKIENDVVREISLGYDCQYLPREDGTFEQRDIRINHVALVSSGRCGAACRVRDHKEQQPMTKDERKRLAEAMELVRELTEAFRAQVQDCDKPQADDRDFGKRAKEFHRGGKPKTERAVEKRGTNDSVESWAEAMNSYGRRLRAGKK